MSKASEKFDKVMMEWESGKLRDSHGSLIKHPSEHKRALATAFSSARALDPKFKMDDTNSKKENGGEINAYTKFDNPILRETQKNGNSIEQVITDLKQAWTANRVGANFGSHPYITYPDFMKSLSDKDKKILLQFHPSSIAYDLSMMENGGETEMFIKPAKNRMDDHFSNNDKPKYEIGQKVVTSYNGIAFEGVIDKIDLTDKDKEWGYKWMYRFSNTPERVDVTMFYEDEIYPSMEEMRKNVRSYKTVLEEDETEMKNGGKAGETSWDYDSMMMFDTVSTMFEVEREKDKDALDKMLAISKKTAYKETLDEFAKESKKLKQDAVKKSLLDMVKNIKAGKYKKEFRFTYGGKAGDIRKVSATSSFFDQFRQAYQYDKMENGGLGTGDVLLKDEGDFYYIYGETEKGKQWMKKNKYDEGQVVAINEGAHLMSADQDDVSIQEFKNGGKVKSHGDPKAQYQIGDPVLYTRKSKYSNDYERRKAWYHKENGKFGIIYYTQGAGGSGERFVVPDWNNEVKHLKDATPSELKKVTSGYADGGSMATGGEIKSITDPRGNTFYLTRIDHTHFYLSNNKESKGQPYHIGQLKGETYYNEVLQWLNIGGSMETGGRVGKNERVRAVIVRLQKMRINPDDVSPNYVNELANDMGIELKSDEVVYISDNFGRSMEAGGRIKVGTFDENQLKNKEDKKAIEKAQKESGLTYIDSKIIKKGGKMFMEVYLIPTDEYLKSAKMEAGGRVKTIKESDIKVGEKFELINGEKIEIKRLFKENLDEDWVEFTRSSVGKKEESSVRQLKNFINNWRAKQVYENGGSIPNNYQGKKYSEVWDSWNHEQKKHFLLDHLNHELMPNRNEDAIRKITSKSSKEIADILYSPNHIRDGVNYGDIHNYLITHVEMGQYENGGRTKDKHKTRVIFLYNEPNEDLFAYFPEEKETGGMRMSYSHVGQHSSASPEYAKESRQATNEEYKDLKSELESIGYNLTVIDKKTSMENGGTTGSDDIEVVYERVSDFKKKPIRLLLLRKGDDERGYTFSGKEAVAVLNKYNRNKQEDLKQLWDLKGYESKYADGGTVGEGKNTYRAFYKGKELDVKADTSYGAQKKAAEVFKARKSYDVTVMLTELGGEQYIHDTSSLENGGVGGFEYKTVNTRSEKGLKEAEKLKEQGWKIISSGTETIQFERPRSAGSSMENGGDIPRAKYNYKKIRKEIMSLKDDGYVVIEEHTDATKNASWRPNYWTVENTYWKIGKPDEKNFTGIGYSFAGKSGDNGKETKGDYFYHNSHGYNIYSNPPEIGGVWNHSKNSSGDPGPEGWYTFDDKYVMDLINKMKEKTIDEIIPVKIELANGGKTNWTELANNRGELLELTYRKPSEFSEVQLMDMEKLSDKNKKYLSSLEVHRLPDKYEPMDDFPAEFIPFMDKPFIAIHKTGKTDKYYYIDSQGYNYARYVGEIEWNKLEDGGKPTGDKIGIDWQSDFSREEKENIDSDIQEHIADMVQDGNTSGELQGDEYSGWWMVDIETDENSEDDRNIAVSRAIRFGNTSGYDPNFSWSANVWRSEKNGGTAKSIDYKKDMQVSVTKDIHEADDAKPVAEKYMYLLKNKAAVIVNTGSSGYRFIKNGNNLTYDKKLSKDQYFQNGGTTIESTSATNKNMESNKGPEWMEIWYIEGDKDGAISNISTSITDAQEALSTHNQNLMGEHGLGSMHRARVLKKDWDKKTVTSKNLKKYLRDLAATGPLYADGGTFDPEKQKIESRLKALELSISSPSTSPEMRAQFQKALLKVQNQLRDYKAAPVQESTYDRPAAEASEVSVSTGSGTKVVVDVDPQSKLDNASQITVSVKAGGEKESAPAKSEIKRTEIPSHRPSVSAPAAPTSAGNFYIDIVEKYSGAMRNVLYQKKDNGDIKTYKIKTFDNIYRVFLESQKDVDLIFKIYNERREKKGDKLVTKADVTGSAAKMKHGGKTKKFSPVKKRVEAKSIKKNLGHKGGSVKSKMNDGGNILKWTNLTTTKKGSEGIFSQGKNVYIIYKIGSDYFLEVNDIPNSNGILSEMKKAAQEINNK